MRQACRVAILCSVACWFALFARAQDSQSQDAQSLGDAARQARQQKQGKASPPKSKDEAGAKAPKVITNDEIPQSFKPPVKTQPIAWDYEARPTQPPPEDGKMSAEEWQSRIGEQKSQIRSLESEIDQLNESIRFAPANCVANCVQWNERQREKQQQVDQMKSQLEEQQKRLEDMQEQARHQGYGTSVYDPE